MATKAKIRQATVMEIASSAPKWDRVKGIIYDVKIIGTTSANKRVYPIAVLERYKSCYEGAGVFTDHPEPHEDPEVRGLLDHFANIHNVSARKDGLYGNLHVKPSHPFMQTLFNALESKKFRDVGLSHNAVVKYERKGDVDFVTQIIRVRSVDLVTDPATTRGLFESNNMQKKKFSSVKEEDSMLDPALDPSAALLPAEEVPADDPAEAVKASFIAKITKILTDTTDVESVAEKILALMTAMGNAVTAVQDEMPAAEGQSTDAKVLAKLSLLERRDWARTALEAAGQPIDPDHLSILESMTNQAAMQKYVAKLPKPSKGRERISVMESIPSAIPAKMSSAEFVKFATR
jgi:hypothetical protein